MLYYSRQRKNLELSHTGGQWAGVVVSYMLAVAVVVPQVRYCQATPSAFKCLQSVCFRPAMQHRTLWLSASIPDIAMLNTLYLAHQLEE